MKVLLLGKTGQVATALRHRLADREGLVVWDRQTLDFTRPGRFQASIEPLHPDVIINAAAYTAVDRAEQEPELADMINHVAPAKLAEIARSLGSLLIHYSTDYVFDGSKTTAYVESDACHPLNVYGLSKYRGECAIQEAGCDHLIFRTSWVYSPTGHNFLLTMMRLAEERRELKIVSDQIGTPTSAALIAKISEHCASMADQARQAGRFESGLYHLVAGGQTSWHGFAGEIIGQAARKGLIARKVQSLLPVASHEYPTAAKRPGNSCLDTEKLQNDYGVALPGWQSGVVACLDDIANEKSRA